MPDVTPPQYTTPTGQVRLLCTDVTAPYAFSDDAIGVFLTLAHDNVKRAGALALDTIASDQVLLLHVIRTDDLSVDGAKEADALRNNAKALRDSADADDANLLDSSFIVVFPDGECYPEGVDIPLYGRVVGVARCR